MDETTGADRPSDAEPQLLRPEEKRAPQGIPWRPDWRESWAGMGMILVLALAAAWLIKACYFTSHGIGWRSDGIIVEVRALGQPAPPRPEVTVVVAGDESYPWAKPPANFGDGPCHSPRFRIDGMPKRGKVYRADEELSVAIGYQATGCTQMRVVFVGEFVKGSPRYKDACANLFRSVGQRERDCPFESVDATFLSPPASLSADMGSATFVATPGLVEPAPAPPSPPDLGPPTSIEGFKLCGLDIIVYAAAGGGSSSSQRVWLDCKTSKIYSFEFR